MDFQKIFLIGAIAIVGVFTLQQWNKDFYSKPKHQSSQVIPNTSIAQNSNDLPVLSTPNQPFTSNLDQKNEVVSSYQFVNVKTDTMDVQIDPFGGDIIGLKLLQYPVWLPKKGEDVPPYELLMQKKQCSSESLCEFTAQSALKYFDGPVKNNIRPLYQVSKYAYTLGHQKQMVVDLTRKANQIDVTKRFTFTANSYEVRIDYIVKNNSNNIWQDSFYTQLKRDGSADPSEVDSHAPSNTFIGAAVRSNEKPFIKMAFNDFEDSKFEQKVKGGYASILQLYFVSALVADQNKSHLFYTNMSKQKDRFFVGYLDQISLKPNEEGKVGTTLYAGPKNQDRLEELADGLQLTMDYGWLWFLSQPLFSLMRFIHSIVGNWGFSIILLTVFVKMIFYPLNVTSFRSMAKMRKLGPKLQALKEQYGDDKQKLSQEMMSIYKKEKVNPMGGCLPILVQMPVFIALYWVLREAVELRQAPWLGWIHDLSQMDPYFILPLLMGVSMFVQQMLNPTPPDPMQAKIMKYMPVAFTFFFLWFPAGLVLYWVTNNLLSIIQQYVITKQIEGQGKKK